MGGWWSGVGRDGWVVEGCRECVSVCGGGI